MNKTAGSLIIIWQLVDLAKTGKGDAGYLLGRYLVAERCFFLPTAQQHQSPGIAGLRRLAIGSIRTDEPREIFSRDEPARREEERARFLEPGQLFTVGKRGAAVAFE